MASSWGTSWGTSWASSWGATVTPTAEIFSGGFLPARKRKTKADIRREREEFGIIPKKAKALILRVAAQHVEEPDNTEALIAAFERAELAYKAQYAALYRFEVQRQIEMRREEEEFLMLH